MALRPHAILRLRAGFFTGGSHLTERTDNGLMAMLKGLAERPPVVSLDEDTTLTADLEGTSLEADPGGGLLTITLPAGLPLGFMAVVRQVGMGTVRIVGGDGTSVRAFNSPSPIDLSGRWATVIVEVRATNDWFVGGMLAV